MKHLLSVLGIFVSCSAFASGSITRETAVEEVCDESENLCTILKVISLEPVGSSAHISNGTSGMPYEFNASVKGVPTWVVMKRDEKGHIVLELR